jgi:hypothetical protein
MAQHDVGARLPGRSRRGHHGQVRDVTLHGAQRHARLGRAPLRSRQ